MNIAPTYHTLGKPNLAVIEATQSARSEELLAAYEHIAKLEADLGECRDYLEEQVDIADGGNRAMQLVALIDEDLHGENV